MAKVLLGLGLALVFFANDAAAEVLEKAGSFDGVRIRYKVVLPDGFDPRRAYPAVLAFAGGSQEMRIVESVLENHFRQAERRGYIVISPEAPGGRLFFQAGAAAFPAFLDSILREYRVEGGKLHVAGRSNGGISAFHIAASHPQYFLSVTGFPGYLPQATLARIEALAPLCIYMHVGENDPAWRGEMESQAEAFRRRGFRTEFAVEAGQGHGLDSLAGDGAGRLFAHFEDAAQSCR